MIDDVPRHIYQLDSQLDVVETAFYIEFRLCSFRIEDVSLKWKEQANFDRGDLGKGIILRENPPSLIVSIMGMQIFNL